ncbi:uncharacterized protein [Nicotiana tomentosiformis]|uniref:uncharacterized protein n=1 Tax=Nicotiana tomentosiformis TaxID=4098 RepID=UPI00388CB22A
MHDFIMVEDSELWDMICYCPFVPMKVVGERRRIVPKTKKEYNDADRKAVKKNFKAKKILVCGIGPDATYEMKRKKGLERREPNKEKSQVLKVVNSDSSSDESDMAYPTRRFQKIDHYKNNIDKAAKRNPIPDRRFKRRDDADNVVK